MIVFHSLQSRFLITDVSYYTQVVGVTKSKRSLKNLSMRPRYLR